MMAPHGFAPSEVWGWSLATYRHVVAALNEANAPAAGAGSGKAPSIEEHRAFKAEWEAHEARKLAAREAAS